MYLSGYKYQLVTWSNSIKPEGPYVEFDHVPTGTDRYIKMIPYYLYLHLWSITDKMLKLNSLSTCASILWRSKCIYEVIDTHCSSQFYVGGNSCKCKCKKLKLYYIYIYICSCFLLHNTLVRIRVRIDPPHPLVCRKRRLNGAVLRMRPEKSRSRVTAGVAW
jgi:hypothetical protein